MFIVYKPMKDGNWIKTISNFCKPLWNKCSDKGCIAFVKDIDKDKIQSFDYFIIKEDEINFWLLDIFGEIFDMKNEQYTGKQYYFDGKKIIESKKIDEKEYKNWKFKKELEKINKEFDKKIEDFTKKYPLYEKMTWETKRVEAEKVLAGQESKYLEELAEKKGITTKELAKKIKQKADEYAKYYTELEAWKDKKIKKLKEEYM